MINSAEEVEADARHTEYEQRGVVAQEAALHGAHRGRSCSHDPGRTADERVLHEYLLEGTHRKASHRGRRAHDDEADQLVEVPLVDKQGVDHPEALARNDG